MWLVGGVCIYMSTPPTHYYLESSERAAYMETHLYRIKKSIFDPFTVL